MVADYVPECAASSNWSDVSFENLLDMSSGNYRSARDHADESATHSDSGFFLRPTHREKIDYACNYFPRRVTPGTRFVYRSSDTYILGTAMNAYLKRARGAQADILDDLVAPDIWRALELGPVIEVSRRTRDEVAQPFAGFGLTLHTDELARLARFLDPGNADAQQLVDRSMLRAALQLDANDRGLPAAADGSMRYNNGLWAGVLPICPAARPRNSCRSCPATVASAWCCCPTGWATTTSATKQVALPSRHPR